MLDLGNYFQLDLDDIRRLFVCELYSLGLDTYATEYYRTVKSKKQITSQILVILATRFNYKIFGDGGSDWATSCIGNMSTSLSTWLKSQDPSLLDNPNVPVKASRHLMSMIIRDMQQDQSDYQLALDLDAALQGIEDD